MIFDGDVNQIAELLRDFIYAGIALSEMEINDNTGKWLSRPCKKALIILFNKPHRSIDHV